MKDKLILGPATNEFGVNCWVAAFDVRTGKEIWRFKTVPEPGEPGNETWPGDSWQHGGAPIWVTGSYDPGNQPDVLGHGQSESRMERRSAQSRRQPLWRFGRRARRRHRKAEVVLPVHAERRVRLGFRAGAGARDDRLAGQAAQGDALGQSQRLLLRARSQDGEFLFAKAFVKQNWNIGFDNGRPVKAPGRKPTPEGTVIFPGTQGGTNWYSPSFSPRTGLFYVSVWDNYSAISTYAEVPPWKPYSVHGRAPRGAGSGRGAGRQAAAAPARPTAPRPKATARSARSIRRPATRSGSSRWSTTPKPVC